MNFTIDETFSLYSYIIGLKASHIIHLLIFFSEFHRMGLV